MFPTHFFYLLFVNKVGDCAYIVLYGSVILRKEGTAMEAGVTHKVGPGESFGDLVLLGMAARANAAQAVTEAEVAVVPAELYRSLVGSIPVEEKFEFLQAMPVFAQWDPYKLYRVAVALQEQRATRGELLLALVFGAEYTLAFPVAAWCIGAMVVCGIAHSLSPAMMA